MDQDVHRAFIDDRVQLFFLGGGGIETIIIEGEEAGVIVPVLRFGPGDHRIQFYVGVKKEIIMGDGILYETAGVFYPFFGILFFWSEDPCFLFLWVFYVIVYPFLPPKTHGSDECNSTKQPLS